MELLLAALLAGGFLGLTAHFVRRGRRARRARRTDEPKLLAAPERGWSELRPQDVLIFEGRDYLVGEVGVFSEGTRRWQECLLDDEGSPAAAVVEHDGEVVLGRPVALPGLGAEPPEALDYEGSIYRLALSGQARVEREEAGAVDVRYWDYRRPGAQRLWIRRGEGAELVICAGSAVGRHQVELLPGS